MYSAYKDAMPESEEAGVLFEKHKMTPSAISSRHGGKTNTHENTHKHTHVRTSTHTYLRTHTHTLAHTNNFTETVKLTTSKQEHYYGD